MTERELTAVLSELGQLWQENPSTTEELGGFAPQVVISLRFGLLGGQPQDFDAIAQLLNIPRERVVEVEREVLTRLVQAAELAG